MIIEGLSRARKLGHRAVVVIGHPEYYPRFGFQPARAFGLEVAFPVPDDVFMVLALRDDALNGVTGIVRYHPAFDDV